jgi:hypothetical protein
MKTDMAKRNRQRRLQDKIYANLIKQGYTDNDRLDILRPDGYHYSVLDVKQYLIYGLK